MYHIDSVGNTSFIPLLEDNVLACVRYHPWTMKLAWKVRVPLFKDLKLRFINEMATG